MKQYKIKVNNEAEAVEVQGLFEKMGYKKAVLYANNFPKCVVTDYRYSDTDEEPDWYSAGADALFSGRGNHQEITLEELRALAKPRLHLDPHNNYAECYADVPQEHWIEELPSINDGEWDKVDIHLEDNVNHPNHYASSTIECIDAMEAMLTPEQFIGYLRGNIFKYQWRYEKKNGIEDLKKSQWYLKKLMEKLG